MWDLILELSKMIIYALIECDGCKRTAGQVAPQAPEVDPKKQTCPSQFFSREPWRNTNLGNRFQQSPPLTSMFWWDIHRLSERRP